MKVRGFMAGSFFLFPENVADSVHDWKEAVSGLLSRRISLFRILSITLVYLLSMIRGHFSGGGGFLGKTCKIRQKGLFPGGKAKKAVPEPGALSQAVSLLRRLRVPARPNGRADPSSRARGAHRSRGGVDPRLRNAQDPSIHERGRGAPLPTGCGAPLPQHPSGHRPGLTPDRPGGSRGCGRRHGLRPPDCSPGPLSCPRSARRRNGPGRKGPGHLRDPPPPP